MIIEWHTIIMMALHRVCLYWKDKSSQSMVKNIIASLKQQVPTYKRFVREIIKSGNPVPYYKGLILWSNVYYYQGSRRDDCQNQGGYYLKVPTALIMPKIIVIKEMLFKGRFLMRSLLTCRDSLHGNIWLDIIFMHELRKLHIPDGLLLRTIDGPKYLMFRSLLHRKYLTNYTN